MGFIYYSQYQQDIVLNEIIFGHKEGGVFLDIGANDGVTYSNTFYFEKNLGWSGLCVEPLEKTFEKLKANRSCLLENCAVGAANGVEIFLEVTGYAEMLSGLKKNYDKRHLERIDSEINKYGGKKREIEIRTLNVNELLAKHSLRTIDYCNIDTEGSEFEILNALDYLHIKIDVITVEANYRIDQLKIKTILFFRGYRYVVSMGGDLLFIHNRLLKRLGSVRALRKEINTRIMGV